MRLRTHLVASLLLAVSTTLPAQSEFFAARLSGDQEVPPVQTNARGWGVVALDSRGRVDITVHSEGVRANAAHLHIAPAGQNGPVIVPLSGGPGTWTGSGTLTAAQVRALRNGGTYLNVHSPSHPGGEIRGQVVAARTRRFEATLSGRNEVPPNPSTATGIGELYLVEPDNRLLYTVTTRGLTNVTAAHVHRAPRGQNGPVVEPLTGANGQYCGGTSRLSAADVAILERGGMYLNIHTTQFPGGEIRGQILSTVADFRGPMTGAQEVPPVRTNAIGHACLEIGPDRRARVSVRSRGLGGRAAHVHRAPRGQNGPIVFGLQGGPTNWNAVSPVLSTAQIADARNGLWYVNIHTSSHPGGEIRGQLDSPELPPVFGGACPDANGRRSAIATDGLACLGDLWCVVLREGPPAAGTVLTLGTSRTRIGNLPLPLSLSAVGAGDCFLFHDLLIGLPARTDAHGCAQRSLLLPLDLSLIGAHLYGQWISVDRRANRLGVVSSNAVDMEIR